MKCPRCCCRCCKRKGGNRWIYKVELEAKKKNSEAKKKAEAKKLVELKKSEVLEFEPIYVGSNVYLRQGENLLAIPEPPCLVRSQLAKMVERQFRGILLVEGSSKAVVPPIPKLVPSMNQKMMMSLIIGDREQRTRANHLDEAILGIHKSIVRFEPILKESFLFNPFGCVPESDQNPSSLLSSTNIGDLVVKYRFLLGLFLADIAKQYNHVRQRFENERFQLILFRDLLQEEPERAVERVVPEGGHYLTEGGHYHASDMDHDNTEKLLDRRKTALVDDDQYHSYVESSNNLSLHLILSEDSHNASVTELSDGSHTAGAADFYEFHPKHKSTQSTKVVTVPKQDEENKPKKKEFEKQAETVLKKRREQQLVANQLRNIAANNPNRVSASNRLQLTIRGLGFRNRRQTAATDDDRDLPQDSTQLRKFIHNARREAQGKDVGGKKSKPKASNGLGNKKSMGIGSDSKAISSKAISGSKSHDSKPRDTRISMGERVTALSEAKGFQLRGQFRGTQVGSSEFRNPGDRHPGDSDSDSDDDKLCVEQITQRRKSIAEKKADMELGIVKHGVNSGFYRTENQLRHHKERTLAAGGDAEKLRIKNTCGQKKKDTRSAQIRDEHKQIMKNRFGIELQTFYDDDDDISSEDLIRGPPAMPMTREKKRAIIEQQEREEIEEMQQVSDKHYHLIEEGASPIMVEGSYAIGRVTSMDSIAQEDALAARADANIQACNVVLKAAAKSMAKQLKCGAAIPRTTMAAGVLGLGREVEDDRRRNQIQTQRILSFYGGGSGDVSGFASTYCKTTHVAEAASPVSWKSRGAYHVHEVGTFSPTRMKINSKNTLALDHKTLGMVPDPTTVSAALLPSSKTLEAIARRDNDVTSANTMCNSTVPGSIGVGMGRTSKSSSLAINTAFSTATRFVQNQGIQIGQPMKLGRVGPSKKILNELWIDHYKKCNQDLLERIVNNHALKKSVALVLDPNRNKRSINQHDKISRTENTNAKLNFDKKVNRSAGSGRDKANALISQMSPKKADKPERQVNILERQVNIVSIKAPEEEVIDEVEEEEPMYDLDLLISSFVVDPVESQSFAADIKKSGVYTALHESFDIFIDKNLRILKMLRMLFLGTKENGLNEIFVADRNRFLQKNPILKDTLGDIFGHKKDFNNTSSIGGDTAADPLESTSLEARLLAMKFVHIEPYDESVEVLAYHSNTRAQSAKELFPRETFLSDKLVGPLLVETSNTKKDSSRDAPDSDDSTGEGSSSVGDSTSGEVKILGAGREASKERGTTDKPLEKSMLVENFLSSVTFGKNPKSEEETGLSGSGSDSAAKKRDPRGVSPGAFGMQVGKYVSAVQFGGSERLEISGRSSMQADSALDSQSTGGEFGPDAGAQGSRFSTDANANVDSNTPVDLQTFLRKRNAKADENSDRESLQKSRRGSVQKSPSKDSVDSSRDTGWVSGLRSGSKDRSQGRSQEKSHGGSQGLLVSLGPPHLHSPRELDTSASSKAQNLPLSPREAARRSISGVDSLESAAFGAHSIESGPFADDLPDQSIELGGTSFEHGGVQPFVDDEPAVIIFSFGSDSISASELLNQNRGRPAAGFGPSQSGFRPSGMEKAPAQAQVGEFDFPGKSGVPPGNIDFDFDNDTFADSSSSNKGQNSARWREEIQSSESDDSGVPKRSSANVIQKVLKKAEKWKQISKVKDEKAICELNPKEAALSRWGTRNHIKETGDMEYGVVLLKDMYDMTPPPTTTATEDNDLHELNLHGSAVLARPSVEGISKKGNTQDLEDFFASDNVHGRNSYGMGRISETPNLASMSTGALHQSRGVERDVLQSSTDRLMIRPAGGRITQESGFSASSQNSTVAQTIPPSNQTIDTNQTIAAPGADSMFIAIQNDGMVAEESPCVEKVFASSHLRQTSKDAQGGAAETDKQMFRMEKQMSTFQESCPSSDFHADRDVVTQSRPAGDRTLITESRSIARNRGTVSSRVKIVDIAPVEGEHCVINMNASSTSSNSGSDSGSTNGVKSEDVDSSDTETCPQDGNQKSIEKKNRHCILEMDNIKKEGSHTEMLEGGSVSKESRKSTASSVGGIFKPGSFGRIGRGFEAVKKSSKEAVEGSFEAVKTASKEAVQRISAPIASLLNGKKVEIQKPDIDPNLTPFLTTVYPHYLASSQAILSHRSDYRQGILNTVKSFIDATTTAVAAPGTKQTEEGWSKTIEAPDARGNVRIATNRILCPATGRPESHFWGREEAEEAKNAEQKEEAMLNGILDLAKQQKENRATRAVLGGAPYGTKVDGSSVSGGSPIEIPFEKTKAHKKAVRLAEPVKVQGGTSMARAFRAHLSQFAENRVARIYYAQEGEDILDEEDNEEDVDYRFSKNEDDADPRLSNLDRRLSNAGVDACFNTDDRLGKPKVGSVLDVDVSLFGAVDTPSGRKSSLSGLRDSRLSELPDPRHSAIAGPLFVSGQDGHGHFPLPGSPTGRASAVAPPIPEASVTKVLAKVAPQRYTLRKSLHGGPRKSMGRINVMGGRMSIGGRASISSRTSIRKTLIKKKHGNRKIVRLGSGVSRATSGISRYRSGVSVASGVNRMISNVPSLKAQQAEKNRRALFVRMTNLVGEFGASTELFTALKKKKDENALPNFCVQVESAEAIALITKEEWKRRKLAKIREAEKKKLEELAVQLETDQQIIQLYEDNYTQWKSLNVMMLLADKMERRPTPIGTRVFDFKTGNSLRRSLRTNTEKNIDMQVLIEKTNLNSNFESDRNSITSERNPRRDSFCNGDRNSLPEVLPQLEGLRFGEKFDKIHDVKILSRKDYKYLFQKIDGRWHYIEERAKAKDELLLGADGLVTLKEGADDYYNGTANPNKLELVYKEVIVAPKNTSPVSKTVTSVGSKAKEKSSKDGNKLDGSPSEECFVRYNGVEVCLTDIPENVLKNGFASIHDRDEFVRHHFTPKLELLPVEIEMKLVAFFAQRGMRLGKRWILKDLPMRKPEHPLEVAARKRREMAEAEANQRDLAAQKAKEKLRKQLDKEKRSKERADRKKAREQRLLEKENRKILKSTMQRKKGNTVNAEQGNTTDGNNTTDSEYTTDGATTNGGYTTDGDVAETEGGRVKSDGETVDVKKKILSDRIKAMAKKLILEKSVTLDNINAKEILYPNIAPPPDTIPGARLKLFWCPQYVLFGCRTDSGAQGREDIDVSSKVQTYKNQENINFGGTNYLWSDEVEISSGKKISEIAFNLYPKFTFEKVKGDGRRFLKEKDRLIRKLSK